MSNFASLLVRILVVSGILLSWRSMADNQKVNDINGCESVVCVTGGHN